MLSRDLLQTDNSRQQRKWRELQSKGRAEMRVIIATTIKKRGEKKRERERDEAWVQDLL